MTQQAFDWWNWVSRQGIFAAMFMGSAAWFGNYIVIPMRDDQKAFMQSVIKTNESNAESRAASAQAMQQLTHVQQTQATTLVSLVDQQTKTTTILQQIRDDQRAGVWRTKPIDP